MEKIKTLIWFIKRPKFWEYALHLTFALLKRSNLSEIRENNISIEISKSKSKSLHEVLISFNMINSTNDIEYIDQKYIIAAEKKIINSGVTMGGAGDITLLYNLVKKSKASKVIETGVAYGWSSLAILVAQNELESKRLVSVDMPYPKQGTEKYVGIVVPEEFKNNWKIIKEPDRRGLLKAISTMNGEIDLCHYDSDKTITGRRFGYELLWNALKEDGIFISDDIDDNLEFYRFMESKKVKYEVLKCNEKYVGLAIKK